MAYRKSLQLHLGASNFGGSLTEGHEPLNSVNFNDLAEREEVVGQGGLWKPRFCGWPIGGFTRKAALARCVIGLPGEQHTIFRKPSGDRAPARSVSNMSTLSRGSTVDLCNNLVTKFDGHPLAAACCENYSQKKKKSTAKARLLAATKAPTMATPTGVESLPRITEEVVSPCGGDAGSAKDGRLHQFNHDFQTVLHPIKRSASLPDMLHDAASNEITPSAPARPLILGAYRMLSAGKVPLKADDDHCTKIGSKKTKPAQQENSMGADDDTEAKSATEAATSEPVQQQGQQADELKPADVPSTDGRKVLCRKCRRHSKKSSRRD
ncbi:hypothetical protein FOZ63_017436 [Perkinsus olseni]|uniref:Uncharacterized protein n=2 Tax=Perkinsus olseni TaxID=32597 RepID=A0A7J6TC99_PEROL|nr:hypothetical protein FOZ63_017436 [Perkinsus olseni]